jgi:hypothetical protein
MEQSHNANAEALYEKYSEAVSLPAQYLELAKEVYVSCLDGLKMTNELMNRLAYGTLVMFSTYFGAIFLLEGYALAAVLGATVALTVWWLVHHHKEWKKNTAMLDECKVIDERMEGIARRYRELTGTDIRDEVTAVEVRKAFEPVLDKLPVSLKV